MSSMKKAMSPAARKINHQGESDMKAASVNRKSQEEFVYEGSATKPRQTTRDKNAVLHRGRQSKRKHENQEDRNSLAEFDRTMQEIFKICIAKCKHGE